MICPRNPCPAMITLSMTQAVVILLTTLVTTVSGHGRLWEPPSRATMWRRGFSTPVDYQDMELFCGGVGVQYGQNGGKCGVCGDPWNGPRPHEAGGTFATGTIAQKYQVGQTIDVIVDLTANHKGHFEFRLCPSDNPFAKVTEECLAKYPLAVEEAGGKPLYYLPEGGITGHVNLRVRLPKGVKCRACFFQWRYTAGNSWGTNPDGSGCIGCGNQEQFYGCSDIAIGYSDAELDQTPTWQTGESGEEEWVRGVVTFDYNETVTEGGACSLLCVNRVHQVLRMLVLLMGIGLVRRCLLI